MVVLLDEDVEKYGMNKIYKILKTWKSEKTARC